jgi:hypothetical protein
MNIDMKKLSIDPCKSCITLEDIENKGIYIKSSEGIRKPSNIMDININDLVYVCNVATIDETNDHFIITKGHQARYINLANDEEVSDKKIKSLEKRIGKLEYKVKGIFDILE